MNRNHDTRFVKSDSIIDVDDVTPEKKKAMLRTLLQILSRFKLDWKVIKAVMVTTGAVISGSAALAVLLEGEFVAQDLDIYVTGGHLGTVLVFLQEQGYNVTIPSPSTNKKNYPASTVALALENNTGEKIDLIATSEPHIVHAITKFHSTCVMNFIAYYGVVSLYPMWTMRKTALVRAGPINQQAIDKYRGRGFAMVASASDLPGYEPNHKCGTQLCCPMARRQLHDDGTLCIPLEDDEWNIRTEEKMRVGWVLQKDPIGDE